MFKKLLPLFLLILSVSNLHAQTVAYITNAGDPRQQSGNTVSVMDTCANKVVATITVGDNPKGVVFSPDGTRAYVANEANGVFPMDSSISVIDTASNTVVATIASFPDGGPVLPAITPDGKNLYVPQAFDNTVLVVSTATNSVVATIPIGAASFAVAITPDGAHAYVLSPGFVSVIATATNTVSAGPITVQSSDINGPFLRQALAITPAGDAVYVASGFNNNVVSVISTATNTVSATVVLPDGRFQANPYGVAITPDGSRVYVTDNNNNNVDVIDTATNTLEPSPIPVGIGPIGVAVTPDGSSVYVVNSFDFAVSVISTANNTVVATAPANANFTQPWGIAFTNLAPTFVSSCITANFNGTAIPSGDALWFSSVAKVSGLGSSPVTLSVRHATISYTLSGTNVTVLVPDADLTFDPSASTATTTFNTSNNRWQTVVPSQGLAGNVFLDGAELMLPNGLPGGVKNVTWTASFSSNTPGITVNWKWAAAAYSSLCGPDLNCLGVKPVDDNKACQYQNSDHAGTPENEKSNLVAGGTGGGGSNFTGGYSGTAAVKPAGPK